MLRSKARAALVCVCVRVCVCKCKCARAASPGSVLDLTGPDSLSRRRVVPGHSGPPILDSPDTRHKQGHFFWTCFIPQALEVSHIPYV
ncbi:hypothetical protein PHYPO_G00171870 [Pangasianodon hypophthalmus]|uniref:Secreted protein n=1 Tax=Pangasianodon hypophthalmus TaxID=310915 RepID=A0A5N5JIM7_PANHP|nr:hypothetical protein PHYPO_G00171870 [Pangasianodon hypophthalmus]